MMFKCSGCLVIGGDGDHEVVDAERTSAVPLVGLDLLLHELIQKASLQPMPIRSTSFEMNLMCWVDPIIDTHQGDLSASAQKLIDKSKFEQRGDVKLV